jgi:GTP-binding protein
LLGEGKGASNALSPEAQEAMGWFHTARFLTTAAQMHHLPAYDLPEIAFVGRSNAGKSTCINVLTQQKKLAYASKTPGRTQHINLFALGRQGQSDAVLADLPGYGYAAVPKSDKIRWQQVMANYLITRPHLIGVVLLCDPRHGLTELDDILLDILRPRVEEGLKFLVLLTKADKLNKTEAAKALSIAKLQSSGGVVRLFSALKKQGVAEASQIIWDWVHTETSHPSSLGSQSSSNAGSTLESANAQIDMQDHDAVGENDEGRAIDIKIGSDRGGASEH